MPRRTFCLLLALFVVFPYARGEQPLRPNANFRTAVYIPVSVVEMMKDPAWLDHSWKQLASQVHIDKVYIETYRSGLLADDALIEQVKAYFKSQGVEVAGGIAYTAGRDLAVPEGHGKPASSPEPGQFVSFSYTDPRQRTYVQHVAEFTAKHFDEIILDDFFFNNTKTDADIAAKGDRSWSDFRLALMDEVSRKLVMGAARAVNPKVKIIIKFPNWYEHFQANGYDLDQEPRIFDGIYTGTETRDPVNNDQHLQQYESYEIVRYFDNIAPGRNGGGWVDTYSISYVDRYAEQLWETMLSKTPQILLFQYSDLLMGAPMGDRAAWSGIGTTFQADGLRKWSAQGGQNGAPSWAAVAGYSLSLVDGAVGHLGKPVGIASYKPYQSTGEDFLQNYLGMIGIPMEMVPEFPTNEKTILLTQQAASDPEIVSRIRQHLIEGGNIVITSGLLKALTGKGIEKIAEITATGNLLNVRNFWGAPGAGEGVNLGETQGILVPEISFMTNDAWPLVRGTANGRGAPLLIQDHYGKGALYVLTIPENPNDLYLLPQNVLSSIRHYLMRGQPFEIDAPSQISLFSYDNNTLAVESFRDQPAQVVVYAPPGTKILHNLVSGESVTAEPPIPPPQYCRFCSADPRSRFVMTLQPHSFLAFEAKQ